MTKPVQGGSSRREFVKQATVLAGGVFISNQLAANASDSSSIRIIDKQVWHVNKLYNREYRPTPEDPELCLHPGLPQLPKIQPVPFAWEEESFSFRPGLCITDNVYIESGKPWVFQLLISTPGKADSQSGSPQYKIWYRTSTNMGRSFSPIKQLIVDGCDNMNPIDGVEIGRNGFNVDYGRPIVKASNGEIMVPVGLHPWDDLNKKIYLPIDNAFLFQDAGVLIGNWLPDGSDLKWQFGNWLRIDHNRSTRGLSEPSIVELNTSGHFAMVSRGSNLGRLHLPCYAWVSFSHDYCRNWSIPQPLGYNDGSSFFVTTAQSALFKSQITKKTYWIGNLNNTNPQASFPRYPLVIGEVDLDHFGVIKETVSIIDTYLPSKDAETVQLSNFSIMEHKKKNEVIVLFTRREDGISATKPSWFRIELS